MDMLTTKIADDKPPTLAQLREARACLESYRQRMSRPGRALYRELGLAVARMDAAIARETARTRSSRDSD